MLHGRNEKKVQIAAFVSENGTLVQEGKMEGKNVT